MTQVRQWQTIGIVTLALMALSAGAFLWRSSSVEAAVQDCVTSSDVADRIPTIAGESTFGVEVVDLVVYRSVETRMAGERTAEIDRVIDDCVARSL